MSPENPYGIKTLSFFNHAITYEGNVLKGYNFFTKFKADQMAFEMNCAYHEGYIQAESDNHFNSSEKKTV